MALVHAHPSGRGREEDGVRGDDVASLESNHVARDHVRDGDRSPSAAAERDGRRVRLGDGVEAFELGLFLVIVDGGDDRDDGDGAEDGGAFDPAEVRTDDLGARVDACFERELEREAQRASDEKDAKGVVVERVGEHVEEGAGGTRGDGVGAETRDARGEVGGVVGVEAEARVHLERVGEAGETSEGAEVGAGLAVGAGLDERAEVARVHAKGRVGVESSRRSRRGRGVVRRGGEVLELVAASEHAWGGALEPSAGKT